jgi:hypothetical protein
MRRSAFAEVSALQKLSWVLIGFTVLVLAAGWWLMYVFRDAQNVSADAIASLAAAAIGVLGTHIGHVTGHELGRRKAIQDNEFGQQRPPDDSGANPDDSSGSMT